jgi:hypothetical protein
MKSLTHNTIVAVAITALLTIALMSVSIPALANSNRNELVVDGEGTITRFLNPDCFVTLDDCTYIINGTFEGTPENGRFLGGYRIDPESATLQENGGFCYEFKGVIGAYYDTPRFSLSIIRLSGSACEVLDNNIIISQNVEGSFAVVFGTKSYRNFRDTGTLSGTFSPTGDIVFNLF